MALESLAPDQRAVVQLVLQQGRSYSELAGLLGISEDAVRRRAQAGLSGLRSDADVSPALQGRIADYLLGQQDEADGAATLALLERSPAARDWAASLSEDLRPVATGELPGVPPRHDAGVAEPDSVAAEPQPVTAAQAAEPVDPERPSPPPRPRRERRRLHADPEPAGATAAGPPATAARDSSRLGGALVLAVVALLIVAGVVYAFSRGDDEPSVADTTSTEATPTATPQAIGRLPLRAADGSNAEGLVEVTATQAGEVGFTLVARNMRTTRAGRSAYGVWLVDEGKPAVRLGFGAVQANQGNTLAVQGPEPALEQTVFTRGLTTYSRVIVSRETSSEAIEPTRPVLRGSLAELRNPGGN